LYFISSNSEVEDYIILQSQHL